MPLPRRGGRAIKEDDAEGHQKLARTGGQSSKHLISNDHPGLLIDRKRFSLEDEFQAELNLPVMGARRCNSPSGIVIGAVLKDRLQVRLAEIGVVEDVEEFGPEREIGIFLEVEPLEEGEVEIHELGSDDGVSPHIPEE